MGGWVGEETGGWVGVLVGKARVQELVAAIKTLAWSDKLVRRRAAPSSADESTAAGSRIDEWKAAARSTHLGPASAFFSSFLGAAGAWGRVCVYVGV